MAARVKLEGDELRRRVEALPRWSVHEGRLSRTYRFPDFKTALAFVNRIGDEAEQQGHHPDIHFTWGRVDLEIWTHDAGGITESDFALAAAIEHLHSGG